MKLIRYGEVGRERPGLVDDTGTVRDLEDVLGGIANEALSCDVIERLKVVSVEDLPAIHDRVRLGPCVARCGKMVCVGLNYLEHIRESGAGLPAEPVLFMKATSAISGPDDDVVLPLGGTKVDWEVELGVVIGRRGLNLYEAEAADHIAGYCVVNDLSERAFQLERGGQWVKGKSADTFGPIGPWLVTKDELPDPQRLRLWLKVNGKMMQDGNTDDMVFGVYKLVSYISQFMTLHPGDVISTGTPSGVGLGLSPPTYLKDGDTMELGIDGLGTQTHAVIRSAAKPT
jgi:2-keto-4-pentenoate hydratase/2-oxohepta-3-ene-1,7-dioic acid hydratase in catechol pathway